MWLNQSTLEIKQVRMLDSTGELDAQQLAITATEKQLMDMYSYMVRSRIFDDFALRFQRQGRIGTYASIRGQEAAQVGSAFALSSHDWIYPSYREVAASFVHGMTMTQQFTLLMGKLPLKQQAKLPIFPVQIIIAAQLLHAVGGAWSSKYKSEQSISVGYMGDGGTSEGDFHEALNIAGVHKLPVIFFIQNNQWAISTPIHQQTASKTIAQKALAYGIEGIQVDGNDVIAVFEVMKLAIAKARHNEPVLIEAFTYRQEAHTTADDATKYRQDQEVENWLAKDPIARCESYLVAQGLWSTKQQEKLIATSEKAVQEAFDAANAVARTTLEQVADVVYAKELNSRG
ncbi:pyruvate dehydrogenase (acetyl-transferring) E1 component subunit alpha [Kurthia sibirica]|uniref:Pyruvate dehydrogenase E1 component subunit alpha n=1 Tax=Kurthia sibirica TaxID=202750 RepID=A0A2U3AGA6_9BACL|nr:pyruvate dehydrogenase (acetyl-transferring) E1 component subunit alpha [Kurthia sibirica]PWI23560.1 pyruvate dehydrogenase (acetyl-transferring) E1 component subunit alpha [Kurthia sibirica]GEK35254.1 pyruvate dehydrogenase (acetyl-transferring) E1 component subunit alpha [Kurthia sibirica]